MAGSVDFRVLGAVEALRNGERLPLGGRRQRALLALLLLEAGRPVPADRLVDELWHGQPPAGASGATFSKTRGLLQISGTVYTTTSAANGTKLFTVVKNVRNAFWKTVGGGNARISVPSYGDQQFARHDPAGAEGVGVMELIVRKNTVVWLLNVKLERRPAAPKAELLGQLEKYALKQKRRVASG